MLSISAKDGQMLAPRALLAVSRSLALMLSINLRELYTPYVTSPAEARETIFLVDQSASMEDKIEALKTAMRLFLRGLPTNSRGQKADSVLLSRYRICGVSSPRDRNQST